MFFKKQNKTEGEHRRHTPGGPLDHISSLIIFPFASAAKRVRIYFSDIFSSLKNF